MDDIDQDEIDQANADREYEARERMWDDQWPRAARRGISHPTTESDVDNELMPYPETVGTSDPLVAIHDAEPYSPPVDPPVLPGGEEGIHVASGFGQSTDEEAWDNPPPRGDEDIREQAVRALQQDSLTSHYQLYVDVEQGIIRLTGSVPSLDDVDHAMAVLTELPGVVDVLDETTLDPALEG
jgi:hypothetical protein